MSVDVGASKSKSDPNVVPLCDILLVLLIIFMVITPSLQKGIDIKLPEVQAQTEGGTTATSSNAIMLIIDEGMQLKINNMPVDISQLETHLSDLFRARQEKVIFIRADETIPYKEVLRILDIVRGAGIETLGLIPEHYRTAIQ